eukprot:4408394-Prymnesium_polylepis.1
MLHGSPPRRGSAGVWKSPAHLHDRSDVRCPRTTAVLARRVHDDLEHARPVLRCSSEELGLVQVQSLGQLPGSAV